jgi:hypothetical protein
VSNEEFDMGFNDINYDTDDSCYVATVDNLVDDVDGIDMNRAETNAESAALEIEVVIPDPPWVTAAAAGSVSAKRSVLNMAINEVLIPKHRDPNFDCDSDGTEDEFWLPDPDSMLKPAHNDPSIDDCMVGEELLPIGEDLAVAVVEEQLTGSPINSALNEARISRRQLIAGRKALKSKRAKLNDNSTNVSAHGLRQAR